MNKLRNNEKFYVVVRVWRGFAMGADIYKRESDATRRFRRLCRGNNSRENDVQIFRTTLRKQRSLRRHCGSNGASKSNQPDGSTVA